MVPDPPWLALLLPLLMAQPLPLLAVEVVQQAQLAWVLCQVLGLGWHQTGLATPQVSTLVPCCNRLWLVLADSPTDRVSQSCLSVICVGGVSAVHHHESVSLVFGVQLSGHPQLP